MPANEPSKPECGNASDSFQKTLAWPSPCPCVHPLTTYSTPQSVLTNRPKTQKPRRRREDGRTTSDKLTTQLMSCSWFCAHVSHDVLMRPMCHDIACRSIRIPIIHNHMRCGTTRDNRHGECARDYSLYWYVEKIERFDESSTFHQRLSSKI